MSDEKFRTQQGITLWFTGLSGSGKTTVALEVERRLKESGLRVERLDGDLVREYLTRDLGFSREDRDENIRRVSYVASLLTRNGVIVLCSFISPYRKARREARDLIGNFAEVYVNAPLEVCEERDVKGLYEKARTGQIPEFTGVSDPYEPPENAEIELNTAQETVEESAQNVINYLEEHGYINTGPADLHLHTTASDGSFRPAELIREARSSGLTAVAVTDHDTTAGLEEAMQAGLEEGIEVIPGLELSALEDGKEIHILGYYIDRSHSKLGKTLARILEARNSRSYQMIEKLNKLGCAITAEQVQAVAGSHYLGRPHIAETMKQQGYINELSEAFTTDYIGRGGKAYVERYQISPCQAIALIKEAGGIPILAHPGYLSDRSALVDEELLALVSCGLQGLEVYYSRHTLQQVTYYRTIAEKHNLLITGGSDCHGGSEKMVGTIKLSGKYLRALKDAAR